MILLTVVFFMFPLLDEFFELDVKNPTPEEQKELEKKLKFKLPLYISVFCEIILTYHILNLTV